MEAAETVVVRPLPLSGHRRFWVVEIVGKAGSLPDRGRTIAYPTRPLIYSDDVEAFEVGEVVASLSKLLLATKVEWMRLNCEVSNFESIRDFQREFYDGAGEEWKLRKAARMMEPKSLKPALAEFDRLFNHERDRLGRLQNAEMVIAIAEVVKLGIQAICTAIDTGKVEPVGSYTSGYGGVVTSVTLGEPVKFIRSADGTQGAYVFAGGAKKDDTGKVEPIE